jgi:hypothetical protein
MGLVDPNLLLPPKRWGHFVTYIDSNLPLPPQGGDVLLHMWSQYPSFPKKVDILLRILR